MNWFTGNILSTNPMRFEWEYEGVVAVWVPVQCVLTGSVEAELCSTKGSPGDPIASVVQTAKWTLTREDNKHCGLTKYFRKESLKPLAIFPILLVNSCKY